MQTFFAGSPQRLVAALLDSHRDVLSEEEIDRLEALVERARREGRKQ